MEARVAISKLVADFQQSDVPTSQFAAAGRGSADFCTTRRDAIVGNSKYELPVISLCRGAAIHPSARAQPDGYLPFPRAEDRSLPSFTSNQSLPRASTIRFVRDDDGVRARHGRHAKHLAKGFSAPVVLFGDTTRPPSVMLAIFSISVKPANTPVSWRGRTSSYRPADGRADLAQGLAESFRQGFALIEVALGRDIVWMERVGVGLVWECGTLHKMTRLRARSAFARSFSSAANNGARRRRRDQQPSLPLRMKEYEVWRAAADRSPITDHLSVGCVDFNN